MLKDEINYLSGFLVNSYCKDEFFEWAYNEEKNKLKSSGRINQEPLRSDMILKIINHAYEYVLRLTKNDWANGSSMLRNMELNSYQISTIETTSKKANGNNATLGGAGAGASAGLFLGGLFGAVVGGIAGAIAGSSYNNQNKQKFYDVLRECLLYMTSCWYENNVQYEKEYIDSVNRLISFQKKQQLSDDEMSIFIEEAKKSGVNFIVEKDVMSVYNKIYSKRKENYSFNGYTKFEDNLDSASNKGVEAKNEEKINGVKVLKIFKSICLKKQYIIDINADLKLLNYFNCIVIKYGNDIDLIKEVIKQCFFKVNERHSKRLEKLEYIDSKSLHIIRIEDLELDF